MRDLRNLAVSSIVLVAFAVAAAPAPAAEGYDNCIGFIDALPAVVSAQGTWCLRHDLSTGASSGHMIDIQTSNVTIDCNGFRVAGASGGASTTAVGIYSTGQRSLAIRHCTVRGFQIGIALIGGSGHLIEDNLLDINRFAGIQPGGDGSVTRRNIITNTGSAIGPSSGEARGIDGDGDIVDNVIDGIFGAASVTNFSALGIYSQTGNIGALIQGNRVRNLKPKGTGNAVGITSLGSGVAVRDNVIGQASSLPTSFGISCADNTSQVRDNVILNYATGISAGCDNAGGNAVH